MSLNSNPFTSREFSLNQLLQYSIACNRNIQDSKQQFFELSYHLKYITLSQMNTDIQFVRENLSKFIRDNVIDEPTLDTIIRIKTLMSQDIQFVNNQYHTLWKNS